MEIRSLLDSTAKRKSYAMYYLAAIGGAMVLGLILKILFGWGSILVRLIIDYWAWIVGGLVALIIIKRFFRKRT